MNITYDMLRIMHEPYTRSSRLVGFVLNPRAERELLSDPAVLPLLTTNASFDNIRCFHGIPFVMDPQSEFSVVGYEDKEEFNGIVHRLTGRTVYTVDVPSAGHPGGW